MIIPLPLHLMARIMGIDYGMKRTGLSVTDPLQIIVTGLDAVLTKDLMVYLESYFSKQNVEKVVIGLPTHKDGNFTYLKGDIDKLGLLITKKYPEIEVDYHDERFTSVMAKDVIMKSGVNKKKRQDKDLVDKVSAVIILQKYLKHI